MNFSKKQKQLDFSSRINQVKYTRMWYLPMTQNCTTFKSQENRLTFVQEKAVT